MLTGTEFYTRPNNYNKVLNLYGSGKYYLVEEKNIITGEIRSDILYTPDQITEYVNNQDSIIEKVKKAIEAHKRTIEAERIEQEKQQTIEAEHNNVYGYVDHMSPIAKGKILKILNKKEHYYNNGQSIGYLSRKNFIKNILEVGGTIEHKKNINYYTKNYELKTKENEYRLYPVNDKSFYSITKTEYNYAEYLKDNILITA